MRDNRLDEPAGELGGSLVAFVLRQMSLENRVGRALAELGFEDRRQRKTATRPIGADPVAGSLSGPLSGPLSGSLSGRRLPRLRHRRP